MTDYPRYRATSLADQLHNGGALPPGIRRVDEPPPTDEQRTPVGQQAMESHVLVPLVWSIVPAVVLTSLITAVAWRYGYRDGLVPAVTFCITFLALYFKRTDRADGLLWKIERALGVDLDGDGHEGQPYQPRGIPVNHRGSTSQLPMPPADEGLYAEEWAQVSRAILYDLGSVSRRGIVQDGGRGRLSQARAGSAANILHKKGYADENALNQAGYDFLLAHLPDYITPRLERPSSGQNEAD